LDCRQRSYTASDTDDSLASDAQPSQQKAALHQCQICESVMADVAVHSVEDQINQSINQLLTDRISSCPAEQNAKFGNCVNELLFSSLQSIRWMDGKPTACKVQSRGSCCRLVGPSNTSAGSTVS
jgi:hypothetical protein